MSLKSGSDFQNALVLSGARGDTRRYRTFHLRQQLRLAGVECALSHVTDPRLPELAARAEVMVLHRVAYDGYVARLIGGVRRRGGLVLLDTDDLIFDPQAFQWIDSPDFRDPVRAALYKEEMARHRQTLDAADGVLTATDFLAKHVGELGKPAWVHRNAASLELVRQSELARRQKRAPDGKLILGYASGTPTHNRDFATIAPPLIEALRTYPELELWIIGYLDLDPAWAGLTDHIRRFAPVDWRSLPFWLARLDINLAPLVAENPFSQSKSEIKFMEAALVGTPTLAACTDAFQYAIRDGENGFLASSSEEWTAKLARLRQPDLRESVAKQAYADALAGYAPQVRARQAVAVLNESAAALKRPFHWDYRPDKSGDPRAYDWAPELERRPTFIEMGLYTLRRRGPATLAAQIWIFFRRWLAKYIPYNRG
jgi:glycosyltransferase involved in cell wall biosynthesis